LTKSPIYTDLFKKFVVLCGHEKPHEYLYKACRVAVAHANSGSKSDPDEADELIRLHNAAEVLHVLARHFISTEFGLSDVKYSGE
jgi:hypothetical protein